MSPREPAPLCCGSAKRASHVLLRTVPCVWLYVEAAHRGEMASPTWACTRAFEPQRPRALSRLGPVPLRPCPHFGPLPLAHRTSSTGPSASLIVETKSSSARGTPARYEISTCRAVSTQSTLGTC